MSVASIDIGVELGGTKVVVAGSVTGRELIGRTRIDTTTPEATLGRVRGAIDQIVAGRRIGAIGIGTFGPIDLRPGSPSYGSLVSTPKPRWSGTDLIAGLVPTADTPVAIDTDVNAALRGEHVWGAATTETAAYLTIGTGVGGGVWIDGDVVHGANHPEIGHVLLPVRADDDFPGVCPYHGRCLEGLASGRALEARFGGPVEHLPGSDRSAAAELAAHYVGLGIVSMLAVAPVETVVIGGGVAHLDGFHGRVDGVVARAGNGYPPVPLGEGGPRIVRPGLGDDAGVVGSIELARRARSGSATTPG